MKIIFSFLLIITVLSAVLILPSCHTQQDTGSEASPSPAAKMTAYSAYHDIAHYYRFEEALTEATDVLYATYNGPYVDSMGFTKYEFKVNELFKGKTETEKIYINSEYYTSVEYAEASLSPFVKGEKYLFMLQRQRAVYFDFDWFMPYSLCYIPLSDLKKSTLYNVSANDYSSFKFDETASVENLTSYIKELVSSEEAQNAPAYIGAAFTDSDRLKDIVNISSYICRVTVEELYTKAAAQPTCLYKCKIFNPLYGSYTESELNTHIKVKFFIDTVKPGDDIIVLLNKTNDSNIYQLSSKNSVRPVEDYDRIIEVLKEQGKVR